MYKKFFKRLIDIVLSLIALPVVLLVIVIMAPFIYFEDKGPVFYNAPRLGKDGRVFKMFKLRSMRVNAPDIRNSDGSTYNAADDPRVTRVGKFMRKTSVDELPQFINVLIGDMSLIGPRAHVTTNYQGYEKLSERGKRRIAVRPGITGYNQAYYRNAASLEEKMTNDIYYVDNLSFWLDVKILFKTAATVLKRENVYIAPESKPAEGKEETVETK